MPNTVVESQDISFLKLVGNPGLSVRDIFHDIWLDIYLAQRSCRRGPRCVRKLFEHPQTDADATLRSVADVDADTPHCICKLHASDDCQ